MLTFDLIGKGIYPRPPKSILQVRVLLGSPLVKFYLKLLALVFSNTPTVKDLVFEILDFGCEVLMENYISDIAGWCHLVCGVQLNILISNDKV